MILVILVIFVNDNWIKCDTVGRISKIYLRHEILMGYRLNKNVVAPITVKLFFINDNEEGPPVETDSDEYMF